MKLTTHNIHKNIYTLYIQEDSLYTGVYIGRFRGGGDEKEERKTGKESLKMHLFGL